MKTLLSFALCVSLVWGARDFSTSGDRIVDGTPSASSTIAAYTACNWTYPTASPAVSSRFIEISNATPATVMIAAMLAAGTIQVARQTSGTARSAISTDTLSLNTWYFVCGTYDGAGSIPKIYISSGSGINTTTTEASYGTTSAGTGTDNSGIPTAIFIGNNSAFTREHKGRMAGSWLFDTVLTTAQMNSLARGYPVSGAVNYVAIQGNVTPELDTSGKGNAFDVTGTTKADHAPIAPSFGWWN